MWVIYVSNTIQDNLGIPNKEFWCLGFVLFPNFSQNTLS